MKAAFSCAACTPQVRRLLVVLQRLPQVLGQVGGEGGPHEVVGMGVHLRKVLEEGQGCSPRGAEGVREGHGQTREVHVDGQRGVVSPPRRHVRTALLFELVALVALVALVVAISAAAPSFGDFDTFDVAPRSLCFFNACSLA